MIKITVDDLKEIVKRINTPIIAHISNLSNPHKLTKSQIGLSNVDNTSDVNKPISNAVLNEITLIKEDIVVLKNGRIVDGGALSDITPADGTFDGGTL